MTGENEKEKKGVLVLRRLILSISRMVYKSDKAKICFKTTLKHSSMNMFFLGYFNIHLYLDAVNGRYSSR